MEQLRRGRSIRREEVIHRSTGSLGDRFLTEGPTAAARARSHKTRHRPGEPQRQNRHAAAAQPSRRSHGEAAAQSRTPPNNASQPVQRVSDVMQSGQELARVHGKAESSTEMAEFKEQEALVRHLHDPVAKCEHNGQRGPPRFTRGGDTASGGRANVPPSRCFEKTATQQHLHPVRDIVQAEQPDVPNPPLCGQGPSGRSSGCCAGPEGQASMSHRDGKVRDRGQRGSEIVADSRQSPLIRNEASPEFRREPQRPVLQSMDALPGEARNEATPNFEEKGEETLGSGIQTSPEPSADLNDEPLLALHALDPRAQHQIDPSATR